VKPTEEPQASATTTPEEREPAAEETPGTTALEAFLPPAREEVRRGLVSARVVDLRGRSATVQLRGDDGPVDVELDPDVDAAVVAEALENGDRVMVESDERGELALVGVLRCRIPEKLKISAATIEIEAEREVVLRSGRAALRLREDGEIDLVGSRISAASRGLFRLVGRMLRLN
jgi:hypothetical protein